MGGLSVKCKFGEFSINSLVWNAEGMMGEAKRRKQTEPNFGRVPKNASYRGLVVSPPIVIEGDSLLVKSPNLDPQELRFALLFWDRLVWPSSRQMHFASGPDEAFLEGEGILTRPDYTFDGSQSIAIARGQIKAYQDLDRSEPGVWALAQGENSLLLKEGLVDEGTGALVELHRAIPIPKHDVPLAEILEFRQRRKDELILLRTHLEALVSDIEVSADEQSALQNRISEIDQACANILILGKEWQFPIYLADFKATFNFNLIRLLKGAKDGWILGQQLGRTAAIVGAAAGGIASFIDIKGDPGLRSVRRPPTPYRYAYRIHDELR
jgi:hypothetical protein